MLGFLRATPFVIVWRHGRRGISSHVNRPGSEDLMVPTLKKWLYGGGIQSKIRRLDFDVEALKQVATRVAGTTCTDIKTIHEGSYNRIFVLKFEGSQDDLVARIPFRSAGPQDLLTKSEVATMDFVRMKFGVPIPKVLAWNSSPYNPVGCEYIITEKCPGMSLAKKLPDTSIASLYVNNVAHWMGGMSNVRFSQFGSIYYKEDVDESLQARPLYTFGEEEDECSERFRIGPSVERAFYRHERANMEFNRGPWPDAYSYLKAFAECEIQWMKAYPKDVMTQRHVGPRHSADRHITALENWMSIIPALLPSSDELTRPALSHPGLSSVNIFIDDSNLWDTSGIIGWQGATIRPLFFTSMPEFVVFNTNAFKYTKSSSLPDNFDELPPNAQAEALEEQARLGSRRRFLIMMLSLAPKLCDGWLQYKEPAKTIMKLSSSASQIWSRGLSLFEHQLMQSVDQYGKSIPKHPNHSELPVTFSPDTRKRMVKDMEDVFSEQYLLGSIEAALKKKGIEVGLDGSVRAEDYFAALEESKVIHKNIQGRLGKRDKNVFKVLWPLRNGKFADNQELCMAK